MSQCSPQQDAKAGPELPEIKVNGVLLDQALFAQELQYHQAESFASVVQSAGQALVVRQLLIEEAGEGVESDEEKAIAALIEKNSTFTSPTEADCVRYFDNNSERFKTEVLLEVDHILLAAPKEDIEERFNEKEKAISIIAQLKDDLSLFAALAEQYSSCPSKKTGGSLGQIGKGQTVPEFEKQLVRLPEGLAEKPIESRYGFHVVRINRKVEGKQLEYPMVAEKIKHYLTQKASQLSIQGYIQSLVEQADIEGIAMRFSDENIVV
ncbi:MAG: peptidylprolyl isomerase [Piscirickettsiaceae bacterium]|nr:MAG: peptidylprolyl isomerase [Piscirickettsiaceae bacterium]PCI71574.1 MAG: peptidylprolyl isomerase [Piscirickettsiaceae bacterium]